MRERSIRAARAVLGRRTGRIGVAVVTAVILGAVFYFVGYPKLFEAYTGVKNGPLTYASSVAIGDADFEAIADRLTYNTRFAAASRVTADEKSEFTRKVKTDILMKTPSFRRDTDLKHIEYLRDAGVRRYEGPATCLECHSTMTVHTRDGETVEVDTLEDVLDSVHFTFQSTAAGFSTYGYDGREVNAEDTRPIPVGKIDRACGIPGSFSWTGWAELIETKPESAHGETVMRSEGCGQCHIGGGYHPATEKMMPIGDVPDVAKDGVDCLICHSQAYDMNDRHVIEDEVGTRWNQDRSMKAAMAVTLPDNENCLLCHQHNMGGDTYEHNKAAEALGYENSRLLHAGAKRANPFSPEADVHYAAGLLCTDCHTPVGHKIPRGTKGTDLVANDLPDVEVACESCHTTAPHTEGTQRVMLNGHVARLACETCHIKELEPLNVVLRDWTKPVWNAEEGVYTPTDILRSGEVGQGFDFFWFNGAGTFLANALGTNPVNPDEYNPLMERLVTLDPDAMHEALKPALEEMAKTHEFDVDAYIDELTDTLSALSPQFVEKRVKVIEEKLRPLMAMGESKIYPFKLFNARMYEHMANEGPFGAMILPFDYATYYETGNPTDAVKEAVRNPIIRRMYEFPFKAYMMDEFMAYFGVDEWKTEYPLQDGELVDVEPHWMRQTATLMVNHGIQRDGRQCAECHAPDGVMDFDALGYPPARVADLERLPELEAMVAQGLALSR
jgi:hypothetical protein